MSLKLINQSSNRKTGGIATTYRAGSSMYGSCPATCSLNPDSDNSATEIDQEYLPALRNAVLGALYRDKVKNGYVPPPDSKYTGKKENYPKHLTFK